MKTAAALASALVVLAASPTDAQMANIPQRLRASESVWGRKTKQPPMKQRKLEKAAQHVVEDEASRILEDMSMSVALIEEDPCSKWDGSENKKKCPKDPENACEFDRGTDKCVSVSVSDPQIDFLSAGEMMESAGVIGINSAQSFAAPAATLNALAFVCAVANYLF